jgi:hypothetical protein
VGIIEEGPKLFILKWGERWKKHLFYWLLQFFWLQSHLE